MMRSKPTLLALIGVALLAIAPAAWGANFTSPAKLAGGSGGEPSIVTDPHGDAYVSGPQSIPAGANPSNPGGEGVGFWASHDDGATFGPAKLIGSQAGGGDSDIMYSKGALYIADLEAAAAQVCKSTDGGNTFDGIGPIPDPGHCSTINGGQAGPSNDREWLTGAPDGTLYLTYHEFVSAQPIAFRDDHAGADDFGHSCGPLVTDPAIEQNVPTDITGGTLVSKPVTDAAGNLYVLFSTTTQDQNLAAIQQGQPSGTFSQLYLAVSHDRCQSFTDYTVFDGRAKYGPNHVQFGDIFNDLAIDSHGNLYTVGAGYVNAPANTTNVYLLSSTDHGQHWSAPRAIAPAGSAYMMPAAVAGGAGQLTIGYFRTINGVTDPNDAKGKWTYSAAESTDAAGPTPHFTFSEPLAGADYHNGEICNAGILCGTVPGGPSDRSLADFTSAALDRDGCPLFTFAGNPTGTAGNNDSSNTFNYVVRQTSDCFTAIPAGSAGGGSNAQGTTPPPSAGGHGGSGSGGSGHGTRHHRHRTHHRATHRHRRHRTRHHRRTHRHASARRPRHRSDEDAR